MEGRVVGASRVPNVGIASDNLYSMERGYTLRAARVPHRNRAHESGRNQLRVVARH